MSLTEHRLRPGDHGREDAAGATPVVVRWGRFFFRSRDFLFAAVFLLIAAAARPRPFGGDPARDAWLDAAGIGMAVLGQALRALVVGLVYVVRGGRNREIHADVLVQTGFFAHCRNPLYVGNMFVYVGLFLILNTVPGYLVGVPFFLVAYLCITAAEEEYLGRRFGAEYTDYCRRVPRFVPDFHGLGTTMRDMGFRWRRVVRKEDGPANAWMLTALALIVYEHASWRGSEGPTPVIRWASIASVVVLAAYGTSRWMKKTHRLDDV